MNQYEQFLKDHICSVCHAGIMEPHPEEQFAYQHYIKCRICGFTKQLKKERLAVHRIINGKSKD